MRTIPILRNSLRIALRGLLARISRVSGKGLGFLRNFLDDRRLSNSEKRCGTVDFGSLVSQVDLPLKSEVSWDGRSPLPKLRKAPQTALMIFTQTGSRKTTWIQIDSHKTD
jgi:hypothetical protein